MIRFLPSVVHSVTGLAICSALCFSMVPKPIRAQTSPYVEWPDDHWAEIARRVPGFAGWWRDRGTIILMLVDTTQRDAAVKAIEAELPQLYRNNIRVRKVDFNFDQLRTWKDVATGDSNVVWSDADEVRNRIVVGVSDSSSTEETRRHLVELGIPSEALVIEVDGPVKWLRARVVAPPNQRMKLTWRGGRLKGKRSILMAAAAPRSLCAIR